MLFQTAKSLLTIAVFSIGIAPSWAQKARNPADIPLKIFAQLPSTSSMKLSPDGTHMAYFVVHKGRQVIIIKPMGKGKAVAVPLSEKAETKWFHWANNERLVMSYAFTSRRGTTTTQETRLYGVDRDGKNFKNLIRPRKKRGTGTKLATNAVPAQIQDSVIDWLSDDPDNILVEIDGDQNGQEEVRRINVYSGSYQEVISGKRAIQHYHTDQQHEIRLAWGYDINLNLYADERINMYRSPLTDSWKIMEKTSWGEKGFELEAFTEDPKIAYASGYNEQGRLAIYRINLETDEILDPVFSHEKVDVGSFINHPVTGNPVGISYTIDKPISIYFDKKLKIIQKTVDRALPNTVNEIVSIQPEKKQYLIHSSSDIEPGVYYLLDMIRKKLEFLAETMPGIRPEDMSTLKAVSYVSRDDTIIPAYLTIPKGQEGKNLPTVILVHGGPHARSTQMFHYMVQFLASRGYAVLQPNFRGSSGYGYRFKNAGRNQWGGLMQDDVTDGTKWLIEQGIADPGRICIAGASYGGYAAAMGLIKTPDLFKCGISISAVYSIPGIIAFDKKFIGGSNWSKYMGLAGVDAKMVSPHHRANDINNPLLVIHAKDDHRVNYRQAKEMVKKLKKLKKDVTFVTMKDGDHNLDTEASRITELGAMEKFLKKHIGK